MRRFLNAACGCNFSVCPSVSPSSALSLPFPHPSLSLSLNDLSLSLSPRSSLPPCFPSSSPTFSPPISIPDRFQMADIADSLISCRRHERLLADDTLIRQKIDWKLGSLRDTKLSLFIFYSEGFFFFFFYSFFEWVSFPVISSVV